jgi:hypothetical protein
LVGFWWGAAIEDEALWSGSISMPVAQRAAMI